MDKSNSVYCMSPDPLSYLWIGGGSATSTLEPVLHLAESLVRRGFSCLPWTTLPPLSLQVRVAATSPFWVMMHGGRLLEMDQGPIVHADILADSVRTLNPESTTIYHYQENFSRPETTI